MVERKFKAFVLGGLDVGGWYVGDWRVLRPEIDFSKCLKCWICESFCPEIAITRSEMGPSIDLRFCKGCGICANECPTKAIKLVDEFRR
jgi:2-oxoacid:acceptor oxidoreductase delta subunit (pyruvate/2-ketoisovalerate family)